MARGGKPKEPVARVQRREPPPRRELPPPLPPERRTVGQLVAQAIRIYQASPWRALALGVLPALVDLALVELGDSRWRAFAISVLAAGPVFTLSFLFAVGLVEHVPVRGRPALVAFGAGVLVYVPFPFLASILVLPGLAWLAFLGFVVPAALVERRPFRALLRRSYELARADFVHVLGGLATLVITVVLSQLVVFFLLRGFADTTARVAAVLTGIAFTPLLFLGAAVLYGDQVARLRSSPRPSRRSDDADVPDVDDADREGRADPQIASGPSA